MSNNNWLAYSGCEDAAFIFFDKPYFNLDTKTLGYYAKGPTHCPEVVAGPSWLPRFALYKRIKNDPRGMSTRPAHARHFDGAWWVLWEVAGEPAEARLNAVWPEDAESVSELAKHYKEIFDSANDKTSDEHTQNESCTDEHAQDTVNHPSHYTAYPIEVIDIIRTALGESGFQSYCLGNEIKYRMRAGLKGDNAEEDIKKAMKYMEFRNS